MGEGQETEHSSNAETRQSSSDAGQRGQRESASGGERTSDNAAAPRKTDASNAPPGPNGSDSRTLSDRSAEPNQSIDPAKEPNQSKQPDEPNQSKDASSPATAPKDDSKPSKDEPNQSKDPAKEPIESKKPAEPNQSKDTSKEPNQSKAPSAEKTPKEPNESKKPAEINRSDGPNGVVISHPIGHGDHGYGRGATGPGGHGLDKDPGTKDWASKAAHDLPAKVGTPVTASHGGTVSITKDPHPGTSGPVYGDQVTIRSDSGAVKTFYTHIDANSKLDGKHVNMGEQIGTVAKWEGHPNDSHLHYGMAVRTDDGSYRGADPGTVLHTTEGSTAGRDVTVTGDGGYIVGDQRYTGPPVPVTEADRPAPRENDIVDTPGAARH